MENSNDPRNNRSARNDDPNTRAGVGGQPSGKNKGKSMDGPSDTPAFILTTTGQIEAVPAPYRDSDEMDWPLDPDNASSAAGSNVGGAGGFNPGAGPRLTYKKQQLTTDKGAKIAVFVEDGKKLSKAQEEQIEKVAARHPSGLGLNGNPDSTTDSDNARAESHR
jgi:hypothetical protein